MTFDPIGIIAKEMRKKMEKILSPSPALCISNAQAEIVYVDEGLEDRLDYIKEYVKINFPLIENGQYSFPISGTLLGFFKMTPKLMFILFGEAGKIGNLLLFRGLLENYGEIIGKLSADMEKVELMEKHANLVLKLRKTMDVAGPSYIEKVEPATEKVSAPKRIEIGGTISAPSSAVSVAAEGLPGVFPELLEKYRNKKFNFMEGIILQFCDGQTPLDVIITKSKFSKAEVQEIITNYERKEWLIMHKRMGGKTLDKIADVVPTTQVATPVKRPKKVKPAKTEVSVTSEGVSGIFPELLEKYRSKKFNFMEGIILQFCDGQTPLETIVTKSNFSKAEVQEIIENYEKKDWLIKHRRKGGKTLDKLIDVISTTQKELSAESQQRKETAEASAAPTIYPELLEKFRNKKFNFKEGIILQYCDGKTTVEDIVKKSKFSEEEVLDVINFYQKKEWLIIRT